MPTFGRMDSFNPELETWEQYTDRLEQYFEANDVEEEKQRAVFLTVIGFKSHNLVRSLIAPAKVTTKTYAELSKVLKDFYSPVPAEITERVNFSHRIRKPNETVAAYMAELRRLAEFCNFGTSLNDRLKDRLISGIQDKEIQEAIFALPEINLTTAYDTALSREAARRNAQELQVNVPESSSEVHRVQSSFTEPQNRVFRPTKAQTTPHNCQVSRFDQPCQRCGSVEHTPAQCPYFSYKCLHCGIVGHLARVCQKASKNHSAKKHFKKKTGKVNVVQKATPERSQSTSVKFKPSSDYELFHVKEIGPSVKAFVLPFKVNGQTLAMEIDTGAAVSLISQATFQSLRLPELCPSVTLLASFTGQKIKVLGTVQVTVQFQETEESLPLFVVAGNGPSLCGRTWLQRFNIFNVQQLFIKSIDEKLTLESVLQKHGQAFEPGLGTFGGVQVHLIRKEKVEPKFFKARSIPYATRDRVAAELDRLQKNGVLVPVRVSAWAAPIVPVLKRDQQSVRICGDFKLTVNTAISVDQYPLPKAADIFASLSGGEKFSKIDLKDAYNQLALDQESQELTVINTHKGLFAYTRLPFGVSAAPAIFQRHMEQLLQGIPMTSVSLDDVLISGRNDVDHLQSLNEVFRRIVGAGLKLQKSKCEFLKDSLTFLGHVLDKDGLHPMASKLTALCDAPPPTNVSELRSFLGLLTYYSKFLPNMSTMLAPLYELLHANTPWSWNIAQQEAFQRAKSSLSSSSVLVHFDPSKEIVLACDASPYGIGAVLSQQCDLEVERPIAFASRTLSASEKNYSHLEKEALALIFGVTRFRDYLLGRQFTLLTDHRPLVSLFSELKTVPTIAAARIQRWALTLSAYDYCIRFRSGKENGNADAFSRLPIPGEIEDPPCPHELVLNISILDNGPVTSQAIAEETVKDPVLSRVLKFVLQGWPSEEIPTLHDFWIRRLELGAENGLLLWGNRIVIPNNLRDILLQELHHTHQGMTSMKSVARSLLWWPKIDASIEDVVRLCPVCQEHSRMPPTSTPVPWPTTTQPWRRIHIDYAGPVDSVMILIVVDSYTKWIEACPVSAATTSATLEQLHTIFSRFGLPSCIVSDNGTPFTSEEFQEFVKRNGIEHLRTAPKHPASNGQAERAVGIVKAGLKRVKEGSLQTRLARILMAHRRTPLAAIGLSPADLMLGRNIKCRLDLIHRPPMKVTPALAKGQQFAKGNLVRSRNFGVGPNWYSGHVARNIGSRMFEVEQPDGSHIRRHVDQMLHSKAPAPSTEMDTQPVMLPPVSLESPRPVQPCTTTPVLDRTSHTASTSTGLDASPASPTVIPNLRRSVRSHRPPLRLDL